MRAGLPIREPQILAQWQEAGIYQKLREALRDAPHFVLHDGRPMQTASFILAMR